LISQIAMLAVDEVVEGTQTGRGDGRAPPQLAVGAGEPALAEATVEVVRPDDPVRRSDVAVAARYHAPARRTLP